MNNLEYLNGVGASSITFTDNRGTNVTFDRPKTKDYTFTETGLVFNLLIGANITEIINPSTALVRYKINVGNDQAVLDFGTLPAGVTVSLSGTIYTVSGITTLAHWNSVKQPTVTVSASYNGTFSYSGSIVYNTDLTANNEFKWNVGIYKPITLASSSFGLSVAIKRTRDTGALSLTGVTTLIAGLEQTLGSVFTLTTVPNTTKRLTQTLTNPFTIVAKPKDYAFNELLLTIDNPYPALNSKFGQNIGIDGTGQYVISGFSVNFNYSAFAYSTSNGNLGYAFPKQSAATSINSTAYTSGDYVVVHEVFLAGGLSHLHLWKKQVTGALYGINDSLDMGLYNTGYYGDASSMTDNYLILADSTHDPVGSTGSSFNGQISVWSLDDTAGITLEHNITGTTQTTPSGQWGNGLGTNVAINDTYFAVSASYPTGTIYIYNTAAGTLRQTLTLGTALVDCFMDGDNLISLFADGTLRSYAMSNGALNYSKAVSGSSSIIRPYDANLLLVGRDLFWIATGNKAGTLTFDTDVTDIRFIGTSKAVGGEGSYDGTYSAQGRIRIRKES
jgi:hypothetical protein